MMKHYRKLLLLPMLLGLAACDSDPTPSVLVDADKISLEVRNADGFCSSSNETDGLEVMLFEGASNLRLFGDDKLTVLIDGLSFDAVEATHDYLLGGDESYCYFVDLSSAEFDADSLSEHLVELEYSRGTQQSYINTVVFPEVTIAFNDSTASVEPFSALLMLDDSLSSPELIKGNLHLISAESDEQQPLCVFNYQIYKQNINADNMLEVNLYSETESCVTGDYSVSDDSSITLQYQSTVNNVDGLEAISLIAESTLDWPFANFTYNQ